VVVMIITAFFLSTLNTERTLTQYLAYLPKQ